MKRIYFSVICCLIFLTANLYGQSKVPPPPKFDLPSYILMDATTGNVIAELNAESQIEPASMTKVMTSYIAADQIEEELISANDEVIISSKAWSRNVEGTTMFIIEGQRVPLSELLNGLIVVSGNDAAIAIAEHIAGTEEDFAALMNQYAQRLGLKNTLFKNSSGLPDANHYSTAKDLALLTQSLIKKFPEHYGRYRQKSYKYEYEGNNTDVQYNRNRLLWNDASVDGVKTGSTDSAGHSVIASAKRNDMRLISVVTGSKSKDARFIASERLLNYGFRYFSTQKLIPSNTSLKTSVIWGGRSDNLNLGIRNDLFVTLARTDFKNIEIKYRYKNNVQAPVQKGDDFGEIEILSNGKLVATSQLIALEEVKAKGFFGRLFSRILLWFINLFNF